ncbi:amino acid adenylation domain-containing protein [Micromonospora sp. SL1-18]|uniref:non-ribosomal peptide synthetase n=1 Tax=Micromonospora sp. SL1-18 TaxID=3399128 RepID=UPI003A4D8202
MAPELLLELHQRGIKLRLVDGRLDVLAPAGALTPDLRERLTMSRDQLVALLRGAESGDDLPQITPRPQERYEPFPLTDIQHAYWVGSRSAVELGGMATHYYVELDSEGLDPDRLARSLRRVVDRHDMLRAVVDADGRQRVLPDLPPYEMPVLDLRALAPADREAELARIREQMGRTAPPADRWPLLDIRAAQLPEGRLRLHVSVNLLIVDYLSLSLLFGDWRRFYEQPDWDPEPVPLSYRDYVLAQESARGGSRYARAEEYWLGRLDTLPPPPDLPLARQPAQLRDIEFVRRSARLSAERWQYIQRMARQRGLTPSAVLMTAFADVLRLWSSRQPSFTLNLTLFDRPPLNPRIGEVMGDFTSLTMLAVEAAPAEASFAARAEHLGDQLMRDLAHIPYSGVRVLRERARRLGSGPAATMPVVFTSAIGGASAPQAADDWSFFGRFGYGISQTPQVWLDHQVMEERGGLAYNWDTVDALFPDGLLDDMFSVYHGLIEQLGSDESLWDRVGPLVALPADQIETREDANSTAREIPPRTLCELVEAQARLTPHAVAVISEVGQLTYRELVEDAHRLARRLRALGATRNRLVGVVTDRGPDQAVAVLGVTLSGAAYLPVDPQWPAARREQLLRQGNVRIVVTTPRLAGELSWPADLDLVTLADAEVRAADTGPLDTMPAPDDLAYVIFTSGSTGQPKGVMIDHRGAANTIQDINDRFQVGPGDRVLALSALSFDLSVYDIFGILAAGGAVVMPSPAGAHDPAHWSDLVQRHAVTVWNSVPALMQAWIDAHPPQADPPDLKLRVALLSGDWIPVGLPDAIRRRYPAVEVISLGGATEASIWSVLYPIGAVPPEWTRIPYGKPMANQTLHVYDGQLRPCPVWTTGEIYIGGVGVAKGYWADPERTAERFIVDPVRNERLYRTGDLGRYLPSGDIEFLGREDFQVKLNGYRIELGEIAAALSRHPDVADALVRVSANPATGRRHLVAYVVPTGTGIDVAAFRDVLEELLPSYLVPHHYLAIDRVPLSANGKVDPSALPTPWDDTAEVEPVAPRDDLEQTLLKIWREVLERDDFGVADNFFELGADSLHAVRILGRLRDELGMELEGDDGLQALFESPTVAELAATLRDRP